MPCPPKWRAKEVRLSELPSKTYTLYYRDIHECIDYVFANPSFAESMDFTSSRIFEPDRVTRIYHEFSTGDLWWKAQVGSARHR